MPGKAGPSLGKKPVDALEMCWNSMHGAACPGKWLWQYRTDPEMPCCICEALTKTGDSLCQGKDALIVQVALHRGHARGPNLVRLICLVSVRLQPVCLAINGQLRHAEAIIYKHMRKSPAQALHRPDARGL